MSCCRREGLDQDVLSEAVRLISEAEMLIVGVDIAFGAILKQFSD